MSQRATYLLGYHKYSRLWRRYAADTMVARKAFFGNLFVVDHHLRRNGLGRGCFVECGTWRGGMSFAFVELCRGIDEFHFFDSFEGLPPAGPEDGETARRQQAEGTLWHDNNTADYDVFMARMETLATPGRRLTAHKGWFEKTLPGFAPNKPISVLRLDGDWYASTRCALDNLFDKVMPGGIVLIDDYYAWDGCGRALHEFLAARQARERIRQSRFGAVPYLIKQQAEG